MNNHIDLAVLMLECSTGRERLIQSNSSARISFETGKNTN